MDYYEYDEEYDEYDDPRSPETIFYHEPASWKSTLRNCMLPSVLQIGPTLIALLGWSFLCRIIWYFLHKLVQKRNHWLFHLCSIGCGIGTLYSTIGPKLYIVLLFSFSVFLLILALEYKKNCNIGYIISIITIVSHFIYEVIWDKPESWQELRGVQMLVTMKIISFSHDLEIETKSIDKFNRGLVPYLGYIFCPATCLLGPWVPYNTYLHSLQSSQYKFRWFLWTVINVIAAVIFLILSNCFIDFFCSDENWIWKRTYRDALVVRCSHYFICFFSQATMNAGGISMNKDTDNISNSILGHLVTKPWKIELPRSLNSVVRNWNIPMHNWLKMYIFRGTYNCSGSYLFAILGTYLVSSLLHGFHFRIYMVLLSLAISGYAENILRSKLSFIFDACIGSNSCRKTCSRKYCPRNGYKNISIYIVQIVNLGFSFLNIFHLAYLGIMMNVNSMSEEDRSIATGLQKWSELNFLSHWIVLWTFVLTFLIKILY